VRPLRRGRTKGELDRKMARHEDKDICFDTPPDWADRTIAAYMAPIDDNARLDHAANMVLTREPMRDGDTLRTHADRQLLELGRQLADFELLESRETQLSGQPAIFIRYAWVSHVGALEQTMTLVERIRDQQRVVATFTTTAPRDEAKNVQPLFANILKSVRFGGTPVPTPTPPSPSAPMIAVAPMSEPMVPMPGYRGPNSRR
jgi:hypothetical protein